MARPISITDDHILELFIQMQSGKTLKQCCADADYDYPHIIKRIASSENLTQLHARAREEFAHTCVQEMWNIANSEPDVQRARLKCDNVKWYAARVLPKNYGDSVTNKIADANGNVLTLSLDHAKNIASAPDVDDQK